MSKWVFVWGDDKEMSFSESKVTGWKMNRANTEPVQECWLMSHDVLHHSPDDTGTFEEEIKSFGAEMWFMERFVPESTLENVYSILEKTIEYFPIDKLILPVNPSFVPPQNDQEKQLYEEAFSFLQKDLFYFAEGKEGFSDNPDAIPTLKSSITAQAYAQRIVDGFRGASQRWPDKEQAIQVFNELNEFFKTFKHRDNQPGETIVITRDSSGDLRHEFYPLSRLHELEVRSVRKPSLTNTLSMNASRLS